MKNTTNKGELSMSDLSEAKYLEMCWKEGMRIFGPVPMISRRMTKDVKLGKKF